MKTLAQYFKALADETRLQIVALLLWEKKLCVCDFEKLLDLTQSKASRHLRYLLNSGIVEDERKNVWVYYSINRKLSSDKKLFIDVFNKVTEGGEWTELKNRLENLLEEKKCNDICSL